MKFQMDVSQLERVFTSVEQQQLPFATSLALNRVGQKAKVALGNAIRSAFDRPTPYTQNAPVMIAATKSNLVCTVKLKDTTGVGAPPTSYLLPEVEGGTRGVKYTEKLLRGKNLLPGGMFYAPSKYAKLDRYGNLSAGQLTQVLTAIKALPNGDSYFARRSAKLSERSKAKAVDKIFIGAPAGGRLPMGVYLRGALGTVQPILLFVSTPHYKVRLPVYSLVGDVANADFLGEFNAALSQAIATAR